MHFQTMNIHLYTRPQINIENIGSTLAKSLVLHTFHSPPSRKTTLMILNTVYYHSISKYTRDVLFCMSIYSTTFGSFFQFAMCNCSLSFLCRISLHEYTTVYSTDGHLDGLVFGAIMESMPMIILVHVLW